MFFICTPLNCRVETVCSGTCDEFNNDGLHPDGPVLNGIIN
jgi:hypothetical protein